MHVPVEQPTLRERAEKQRRNTHRHSEGPTKREYQQRQKRQRAPPSKTRAGTNICTPEQTSARQDRNRSVA